MINTTASSEAPEKKQIYEAIKKKFNSSFQYKFVEVRDFAITFQDGKKEYTAYKEMYEFGKIGPDNTRRGTDYGTVIVDEKAMEALQWCRNILVRLQMYYKLGDEWKKFYYPLLFTNEELFEIIPNLQEHEEGAFEEFLESIDSDDGQILAFSTEQIVMTNGEKVVMFTKDKLVRWTPEIFWACKKAFDRMEFEMLFGDRAGLIANNCGNVEFVSGDQKYSIPKSRNAVLPKYDEEIMPIIEWCRDPRRQGINTLEKKFFYEFSSLFRDCAIPLGFWQTCFEFVLDGEYYKIDTAAGGHIQHPGGEDHPRYDEIIEFGMKIAGRSDEEMIEDQTLTYDETDNSAEFRAKFGNVEFRCSRSTDCIERFTGNSFFKSDPICLCTMEYDRKFDCIKYEGMKSLIPYHVFVEENFRQYRRIVSWCYKKIANIEDISFDDSESESDDSEETESDNSGDDSKSETESYNSESSEYVEERDGSYDIEEDFERQKFQCESWQLLRWTDLSNDELRNGIEFNISYGLEKIFIKVNQYRDEIYSSDDLLKKIDKYTYEIKDLGNKVPDAMLGDFERVIRWAMRFIGCKGYYTLIIEGRKPMTDEQYLEKVKNTIEKKFNIKTMDFTAHYNAGGNYFFHFFVNLGAKNKASFGFETGRVDEVLGLFQTKNKLIREYFLEAYIPEHKRQFAHDLIKFCLALVDCRNFTTIDILRDESEIEKKLQRLSKKLSFVINAIDGNMVYYYDEEREEHHVYDINRKPSNHYEKAIKKLVESA